MTADHRHDEAGDAVPRATDDIPTAVGAYFTVPAAVDSDAHRHGETAELTAVDHHHDGTVTVTACRSDGPMAGAPFTVVVDTRPRCPYCGPLRSTYRDPRDPPRAAYCPRCGRPVVGCDLTRDDGEGVR